MFCNLFRIPLWYVPIGLTNSSLPQQNGRHFADDILRCIFVNEKFCIFIKISLKFVPRPIDNDPALVWIMSLWREGDKPLSEPMLTRFTKAYARLYRGRWVKGTSALIQVMSWRRQITWTNDDPIQLVSAVDTATLRCPGYCSYIYCTMSIANNFGLPLHPKNYTYSFVARRCVLMWLGIGLFYLSPTDLLHIVEKCVFHFTPISSNCCRVC